MYYKHLVQLICIVYTSFGCSNFTTQRAWRSVEDAIKRASQALEKDLALTNHSNGVLEKAAAELEEEDLKWTSRSEVFWEERRLDHENFWA
jgi:hypothetical protein